MSKPIVIELVTKVKFSHAIGENQKEAIITQLRTQFLRDFLYGSFGNISKKFFKGISVDSDADYEAICDANNISARVGSRSHNSEHTKEGVFPWSIEVQDPVFEDPSIGLQHLLGILISDAFSRSHQDVVCSETVVENISLGSVWEQYFNVYRKVSNSIEEIWTKFKLETPLLAFTVKPRTGWESLDISVLEKIVRKVIASGFNIVEMDTRSLWSCSSNAKDDVKRLVHAALEESSKCGHVGVFSPNLSMPLCVAREFYDCVLEASAGQLTTIKIDGSLDGLTTIQGLRRHYPREKPIITSYPLIRYSPLENRLGRDTYVRWLALCGADIVYPGGAPRLRTSGELDRDAVRGAQIRYNKMTEKGWPLPSLAGGVHPGDFHAYMELVGPYNAFFVGGGVSSHKEGLIAGAEWARRALDKATALHREDSREIYEESQAFFGSNANLFDCGGGEPFRYTRPESILSESGVVRYINRGEQPPFTVSDIEPSGTP